MRQRLKKATAEFVEGQLVPGLTRSYRQPQRGSRPACVLALGVPESRCLAAIDGRHCAAEPCVGLGSDRLNVGQSCFLGPVSAHLEHCPAGVHAAPSPRVVAAGIEEQPAAVATLTQLVQPSPVEQVERCERDHSWGTTPNRPQKCPHSAGRPILRSPRAATKVPWPPARRSGPSRNGPAGRCRAENDQGRGRRSAG
jgi:hypothetical protein